MSKENVAPQTSATNSFLSGGFGGVAAVFIGHPFDLAKTTPTGTYKGTLDVFKQTLKADGFRELYRGMATPLLGVTPVFAISFWAFDVGKKIVYAATPSRTSRDLNVPELAFAGFFSAFPIALVTSPSERIKVVLQTQGSGVAKQYDGPVAVARILYQEGGLPSILRGTGATLLRDGPGYAAYFGMAGVAMWFIAIPPDVLKSRLQSAPAGTYKGTADVLRNLWKNEGPQALFKGLGPTMLRAFPANAASFLGVEYSLRAMSKMW
ncbi:carnitine transporter [Podila minutissima]|uniref:Carnitine transporter n=1 Tax=Podila minutissima TaxID=64525 RepID=A0A9P5SWX6_9FUNG|nr:carnitine transporter [Podila minutissima]